MREITTHKVNGLNEALKVAALDEPGQGNACHSYSITPTTGNALGVRIDFQNGPLKETVYPNGLSNESLLAIVRDRLEGFQSGPYACELNQIALRSVINAMAALNARTSERVSRGVEGTHEI